MSYDNPPEPTVKCPDCDGSGESAESLDASLISQSAYLAAPPCRRCNGEGWIEWRDAAESIRKLVPGG